MSWLMNLILILIATAVVAWVFRFAGQKSHSQQTLLS